MDIHFIERKIQELVESYSQANIIITIKGLPIKYIPSHFLSKLKDKEMVEDQKINENLFFTQEFQQKISIDLIQPNDEVSYILYETLVQNKETLGLPIVNKKVVIIDFSLNAYAPNNFDKFNTIISDLVEKGVKFDIEPYDKIIANSQRINENIFIQFRDQELLKQATTVKVFQPEEWEYSKLDFIDENVLKDDDWVFNPDDMSHLEWFYEILKGEKKEFKLYVDNDAVKSDLSIEEIGTLLNTCDQLDIHLTLVRIQHNLQLAHRDELTVLLSKHWHRPGKPNAFKGLKVYLDPDISKETIEISQADVVENIIQQFENGNVNNKDVQDIFLTAPTGAGKSLLFQMPAMYIGEKYEALSIVISPLKALMVDQVKQLREEKNYSKVAYINSDISVIKREEILESIATGNIDILYMAPELLLSYDISYFLNGRKLGLYIVDEAHTVSTWGRDFRIDYWYLGYNIQRIRKYSVDKYGKKLKFPVVAVTATAPYGSIHDVAFETMKGLQMKSPIKYIGYAKRDNIEFEINHTSFDGNLQTEKVKKTVERIEEFENNSDKTIVYCPFTTQVNEVFNASEANNLFTKRYFSNLEETVRKDSYEEFKNKRAITMIATKAFGMGIDIPDIDRVYHLAPTGLLTDYIQEIGRAGRNRDTIGKASLDYSSRDFQFINQLHGLSRMHNWQLREVLRRLVRIYNDTGEQNHLLNIEDFANIFNKDKPEDLTNEVKKSLLLLEKDLNFKFSNIPVLIARPKNMFSTVFASVNNDEIDEFLNIYGEKNVKIINYSQIQQFNKKILHLSLDRIWEENFRKDSFGVVKRKYFNENLFEGFDIHAKIKIDLKIHDSYGKTMNKIKEYFSIINRAINAQEGFFSSKDFKIHLVRYGMQAELADRVGDIFLSMFSQTVRGSQIHLKVDDVRKHTNFLQARRKKGEIDNSYRLVVNALGLITRNIKGAIVRNFKSTYRKSSFRYCDIDSGQKYLYIKTGQILELFDLGSYEVSGGENPKMFVRINDPFRLKLESKKEYENSLLNDVSKKHKAGVDLMREFFESHMNSEERWEFLEDYLLGQKN